MRANLNLNVGINMLLQQATRENEQRRAASVEDSIEDNVPSTTEAGRVTVMALAGNGYAGKQFSRRSCCCPSALSENCHLCFNPTIRAVQGIAQTDELRSISCIDAIDATGDDAARGKKRRRYSYINRPRGKALEPSPLKTRRVYESRLTREEDFRNWVCCKSLSCFRNVDMQLFRAEREYLLAASQQKRKEYLTSLLRPNRKFEFNGRQVCAQFLIQGFGFSKDLQRTVKGTASVMESTVKNEEPGANAHQRKIILEFLEHLAAYRMAATATEISDKSEPSAFPFFRKKHFYRVLLQQIKKNEVETGCQPAPSFCYFVSIWNKYYSGVNLEQGTGCESCRDFRSAKVTKGGSYDGSDEALKRRRDHLQLVERERASYNMRKKLCIAEPHAVCSIAIGGLQQNCFSLPHFCNFSLFKKRKFARGNVVGLLENGRKNNLHLYVHLNQFADNCSVLVEILHRFINERAEQGRKCKCLFIDLNIARTELNEVHFLCYLECIVAWGIYDEIQLFFALPGHAHPDLLLGSRCAAEALSMGDVKSLDELEEQLKLSNTPQPSTCVVDTAANFSALLENESSVRKIHSLAKNRQFRITRATGVPKEGTGRFLTSCSVRESSMEPWRPLYVENASHGLLVKAPDLRLTPPICASVDTEFKAFQSSVSCGGQIPFSWDLSTCVEGQAREL